jgi:7-carboxy-7-deazaguanine synthase
LTDHLLADGYRVLVETSGERNLAQLPRQVVKVLDVKCPGSGEEGKFCFDNLAWLERKDQIKFVILNEDDYRYARGFLAQHNLHRHVDEVIFSPVFDQLEPRSLAAWILRDGLEVRLGLQLHKFIWGTGARGV